MINDAINSMNNVQYLSFSEALENMRVEVDRALSSAPAVIRGYTEHLNASKGKHIRAMSLLACAIRDDLLIHPDAVRFAAAIEILHLATLVHDDVIDDSDLRRGMTTLQKKFGKKTAVICGDYLFSAAFKMAASVTDRESYLKLSLPDYIGRICLGELNQHLHNGNLNLSFRQYIKIISGKTAALFEASFYAGSILSGEDSVVYPNYRRLGHHIGVIFQLTDDCIDYEESESTAKKPVQSDFEQGVITLPLIYTFDRISGFREKAKESKVTAADITKAVRDSDGMGFTRMVAGRYYEKSVRILRDLSITDQKRERMTQILDKAFFGTKKTTSAGPVKEL